ncbi:PfkB family carbohydrate kinase [Streptomyces sp. MUM 178J]|uniref:PfkB family carbohydrate kinase n=1 Tax=Streptomyces sp. MUM 178J TaxID=2791991 RepID=UPI001F034A42|nr:PfkB family carbohydrate kinase [Streptomyces sp. MUM 178J]WRQ79927.1 PfkB family carbohydrate kinase [Streptomyces sp. MUM 178J]
MSGGREAVLVLGEALVDLIPAPGAPGVLSAEPGGAPANVAAGLARLGTPVAFAGTLGGDALAGLLQRRLTAAGVDLSLCGRSALPTPLAVADPAAHGNGYRFHLQATAAFHLAARTADVARFGTVYAGGLAAVVEPAARAVAETARAAAAGDSLLVVDPNVRADRTLDPLRGPRLLRELCALAHVVKASDEDLAQLWPHRDPRESCRRLAAHGRLAVLTRGAEGSAAYLPDGSEVRAPAVPVDVVNTIGAGDAFTAAVLSRLAGLRPEGIGRLAAGRVEEMLSFAARTAAAVCAQEGTEVVRPGAVTV